MYTTDQRSIINDGRIEALRDTMNGTRWVEGVDKRVEAILYVVLALAEDRIAELEIQKADEDAH